MRWPAFRRGITQCVGLIQALPYDDLMKEDSADWQGFDFYCPRLRFVIEHLLPLDTDELIRWLAVLGVIVSDQETLIDEDDLLAMAAVSRPLLRNHPPIVCHSPCTQLMGGAFVLFACTGLPVAVWRRCHVRLLSVLKKDIHHASSDLSIDTHWQTIFRVDRWLEKYDV